MEWWGPQFDSHVLVHSAKSHRTADQAKYTALQIVIVEHIHTLALTHSQTSPHSVTHHSSHTQRPVLTQSHTIPHTLTHQSSHSHTPALTHSHTSPHTVTHQASPHTLTHQTSPHTLTHQASPHQCIKQTPVHYLDIRICQHTYWIQPQNLQSSACVTKI